MLRPFLSCSSALLRASFLAAPVAVLALLTGSTPGQCYSDPQNTNYQITAWSSGTSTFAVSAQHIPLGFAFPIAGAQSSTYQTMKVGENGWIQLTNFFGPLFGYPNLLPTGTAAALAGSAGDQPLIAPFWGQCYTAFAGAGSGVWVEWTQGQSCRVTWQNAVHSPGSPSSFSAELFADGSVVFAYDHRCNGYSPVNGTPAVVGVSRRNGIAIPPSSDLFPGPTNPFSQMIYEGFAPGTFDGANQSIVLTPTAWGWQSSVQCNYGLARHGAYGAGCYDSSNSCYELHANATAASAALTGQAYQFTPVGGLYRITSGGSFLPPLAPVPVFLTPSDDGETVVTPSQPLPTPQGPQASLRVHANGIVSWGGGGQTFPGTSPWVPTAAAFLGGANAGIYAWHDYNEAEAGSGRIVREERVVGGETLLVLTWHGVENYSAPTAANPSTMQIQCNLTTGVVTLVFPSIDGDASSPYGSEHLIGCSPAGASPDGGSQSFAQSLPRLAGFDATAMTLTASPAPISTGSSGTLVTYTQSSIPEAAGPGSAVRLGVTIVSFGQDQPGTDLAFLGMPGCNLHVASLDILLSFIGFSSTLPTQLPLPAGVPYGTEFFAQSIALIAPGTWNVFGATVSNGVASFVSTL
jgi:hypothetical protein